MATPAVTVTVLVPERTAPVVPVPEVMASVTWVALSVVMTLPLASSTATVIAGEILAPAVVLLGWAVKASLLAGPIILKLVLVAVV